MLQNEFIERGGKLADYVEANGIYVALPQMGKNGFCQAWNELQNCSPVLKNLVAELTEEVYDKSFKLDNAESKVTEKSDKLTAREVEIESLCDEMDKLKSELNELKSLAGRYEIIIAKTYGGKSIYDAIVDHLDTQESIKLKSKYHLPLTECEYDFICMHI